MASTMSPCAKDSVEARAKQERGGMLLKAACFCGDHENLPSTFNWGKMAPHSWYLALDRGKVEGLGIPRNRWRSSRRLTPLWPCRRQCLEPAVAPAMSCILRIIEENLQTST